MRGEAGHGGRRVAGEAHLCVGGGGAGRCGWVGGWVGVWGEEEEGVVARAPSRSKQDTASQQERDSERGKQARKKESVRASKHARLLRQHPQRHLSRLPHPLVHALVGCSREGDGVGGGVGVGVGWVRVWGGGGERVGRFRRPAASPTCAHTHATRAERTPPPPSLAPHPLPPTHTHTHMRHPPTRVGEV